MTTRALPTGTVTFLFTDIEGSTRLLQRLGQGFREVVEEHHRILREAIRGAGGIDLRTEGDAFFAVFPTADAAVRACVEAQRALAAHAWPQGASVRVRMGLHTGQGILGGDDYMGMDVHRAARIASTGHGGQIVVSASTAALCENALPDGASLRDLGTHRLKDLPDMEHLRQVVVPGLPQDFPPLRSLDVASTLPQYPTRFIGRHADVSAVRERLEDARLVTVTGPGGTGKTRLAVEVARGLAERYPGGATFVDLSPITETDVVGLEIASVLGIEVPQTGGPFRAVVEGLRDRSMLLVLDNFEQVVDAADGVAAIIAGAPKVDVLVTSRESLGIRGEHLYPLAPLGTGKPGERTPGPSDAVELFVDRARAVEPSFEPDARTVATIAEICARLDGMPLAIELAASRMRTLTAEELLARLDRRLPLLTGGPRDVPARQRTLRAAIEWSHDLLEEPERVMFRRLSVFAGGWSGGRGLRAAAEVVDPEGALGDPLDVVGSLVQKSLVRREPETGRFSMYETIREFAFERLAEAGELDEVRERHAMHVLALAGEAERELTRQRRVEWLERLSEDHDNIRAAMDWALEQGRADVGLRIGAGVWRFWQARRGLAEGRARLEELLAAPSSHDDVVARARGLSALGGVRYWQGDYPGMTESYQERLAIARELGDKKLLADALADHMFVFEASGEFETAKRTADEARSLYEELGDELGLAFLFLDDLFHAAREGDMEGARRAAAQALPLLRAAGDTLRLPEAIGIIATDAADRGPFDEAWRSIEEALDLNLSLANAGGIAVTMHTAAMACSRTGRFEESLRLLGARDAVERAFEVKVPPWALEGVLREPIEEALEAVAPEDRDRLASEGRAFTVEEAVGYLREVIARTPDLTRDR